ncbi:MAG: phosphoglycolate phosphatase [Hyphomicrobiaceae bacterium]|jgi:phosphoglycolate phosphatase
MTIRAVIFDCDGVLFRSERANVAFYNDVLRSCGQSPLPSDGEADAHAMASAQLFAKRFAKDPELATRLRKTANELDYTPYFSMMDPRAEMQSALQDLRDAGHRTAMATNRGKTTATVIEHFGLHNLFDFWVGALDVAVPKPAPDMLELCLERLALEPAEAVYVGDQPSDLAASQAAGLRFIAMPPVSLDWSVRVESLDELPALVASMD